MSGFTTEETAMLVGAGYEAGAISELREGDQFAWPRVGASPSRWTTQRGVVLLRDTFWLDGQKVSMVRFIAGSDGLPHLYLRAESTPCFIKRSRQVDR